MKMIGNVSDWPSYAGGALIKVADSAGSTVFYKVYSDFLLARTLNSRGNPFANISEN